MNPVENTMDIENYGVIIDKKRQRFKCNYCSKEMSGSYRLKCHLGGIRGDVKSCESRNLPDHVKYYMRKLVNGKKGKIIKKTRKPHSSANLQRGIRNLPPNTGNLNLDMTRDCPLINLGSTSSEKLNKENAIYNEVQRGSSTQEAKVSVGGFFYETETSITMPNHSSIQRMVTSIISQPHTVGKFPSCEELRGWNFDKLLARMCDYVKDIKQSWEQTGCTILLEPWANKEGNNFILMLADCPKGPIYLRSYNLSSCVRDDYPIQKLIDRMVKKVGAEYIVQILIDSFEFSRMFNVESNKYDKIFRSPSATFCIEVILKQLAESRNIKVTLAQAKIIMEIIYRNITTQMIDKENGCYLLSTTGNEFVDPFLTLENMLDHKENLKAMIQSSENSSVAEKKQARFMVNESTFWDDIKFAVKVASPLMEILSTLKFSAKPQLSYVYEAMDQAKEKIKTNLEKLEIDEEDKQCHCRHFWDLIDNVWNNHMYTPLHAAAHLFNPSYDRSNIDSEIQRGFEETVNCMVQDESFRNQIFQQVHGRYLNSSHCSNNGHMIAGEENLSPAEWWSVHVDQFPQLAKFATKVVSQTCAGASRYRLNKSMAEDEVKSRSEKSAEGAIKNNEAGKVQASSSNKNVLQQRMIDRAFVYYNMQLQHFKAYGGFGVSEAEDVDLIHDWIFKDE